MDHSVMQGVEVVDSVLLGTKEATWKPSEPSGRKLSLAMA